MHAFLFFLQLWTKAFPFAFVGSAPEFLQCVSTLSSRKRSRQRRHLNRLREGTFRLYQGLKYRCFGSHRILQKAGSSRSSHLLEGLSRCRCTGGHRLLRWVRGCFLGKLSWQSLLVCLPVQISCVWLLAEGASLMQPGHLNRIKVSSLEPMLEKLLLASNFSQKCQTCSIGNKAILDGVY